MNQGVTDNIFKRLGQHIKIGLDIKRSFGALDLYAILISAACLAAAMIPFGFAGAIVGLGAWALPAAALVGTGLGGFYIGRRLRREYWLVKLVLANPGAWFAILLTVASPPEAWIAAPVAAIVSLLIATLGWFIGGGGKRPVFRPACARNATTT